MATYLVTGGAGFIGSHIAEALVLDGQKVRILDNLATGMRRNMVSFEKAATFIEADIRDVAAVAEAMDGVDYVIHQAALASVPRSIADPSTSNQVNVQGTLNLLDAARKNSVKRFVYASSSSVYGDSEVLPKREDMPPNPKSPYAVSKLAGELYCRVFHAVWGMSTVGLRYFNVFGPRQDPNSQYSAVIPLFASALLRGEQPTIFGDGEQSRDFTFIDNVVHANLLACHSTGSGGAVYNVACGERYTLNALFERLRDLAGADVTPEYGDPRPGDVRHSQAAIARIETDLDYHPRVTFDEGLARTVAWYRKSGPHADA